MIYSADLHEIIKYFPESPVISIAGAGGKTTLMFRLADLLERPCVTTTTTKVGALQIRMADICLGYAEFPPEDPAKVMWVSPSVEPVKGKISGFESAEFRKLAAVCRDRGFALVNEADGAACRHIKAPASHEPVIPSGSDVCIYCVGLDVLGKPLNNEYVHRPEILSGLTGIPEGTLITAECIRDLLDHPEGGLKNMPAAALKIVYLTHADTPERISAGKWIAEHLKNYDLMCVRN